MALTITIDNWKDIQFSVDLVPLASKTIEFIEFIHSKKTFYSHDVLQRAIYRYEKYWLPFYNRLAAEKEDLSNYYPPFDIAWVCNYFINSFSLSIYSLDLKYKSFSQV